MKAYKKKLKRHKDAVLTIHSPKGIEGGLLVSGSADHSIRSNFIYRSKSIYDSLGFIKEKDFK